MHDQRSVTGSNGGRSGEPGSAERVETKGVRLISSGPFDALRCVEWVRDGDARAHLELGEHRDRVQAAQGSSLLWFVTRRARTPPSRCALAASRSARLPLWRHARWRDDWNRDPVFFEFTTPRPAWTRRPIFGHFLMTVDAYGFEFFINSSIDGLNRAHPTKSARLLAKRSGRPTKLVTTRLRGASQAVCERPIRERGNRTRGTRMNPARI